MSEFFHPKLQAVEALAPYRLRTTWITGEVLDVDVEAVLRSIPALTKLLDPQVFSKVRLAEWAMALNGLMRSWARTMFTLGLRSKPVK